MGHVCFLWKVKLVEEVEYDNRVKLQKRNGGGRCIFKRESTFLSIQDSTWISVHVHTLLHLNGCFETPLS